MKKNDGAQGKFINCQEICAVACKRCKPHCIRECTISLSSPQKNCSKATQGCCSECKDDCNVVCSLAQS